MSVQSDEDDEYLAMVERQRARALATIERVRALLVDDGEDSPHWIPILKLRAALEPTDLPKGTKP